MFLGRMDVMQRQLQLGHELEKSKTPTDMEPVGIRCPTFISPETSPKSQHRIREIQTPLHIMSSKLNIGVVGIGRMGQRHALNILHRLPRARLLCVCSPAPHEIEWAEKALKPEGVQVFTDMEQMIQTPGLQAVVIASSTNLHIMHTRAAMERGIHVLCEKPITTDVAEVCSFEFLYKL